MSERKELVDMADGAGGEAMQDLITNTLLENLPFSRSAGEVPLEMLDDAAVIGDVVISTDMHTVKPIFFPGGDIGVLSVAGTVNDTASLGAKVVALAMAYVVEEGFPRDDLVRLTASADATAREAGVPIVTGDTKVVEGGAVDRIYVCTTGIGLPHHTLQHNNREVEALSGQTQSWLLDSQVIPGASIILSGHVGDHGLAVLAQREGYGFDTEIGIGRNNLIPYFLYGLTGFPDDFI